MTNRPDPLRMRSRARRQRRQSEADFDELFHLMIHLVEAHEGSIAALSDGDGNGATFVVRLPLTNSAVVESGSLTHAPVPIEHLPELTGRRVLVVEDHADSRAHADSDGRAKALVAGYQRHLSKPVEPEELIQAVSAVLRPR